MTPRTDKYAAHKNAVWIVIAVMLTASASGYFMGLRQTASVIRTPAPFESELVDATGPWPSSNGVPQIAEYPRLSKVNYKANANWTNSLEKLAPPVISLATRADITPDEAAASLKARAQRRAYDGAPPVIPHEIDQSSSFDCLACHAEATPIKNRIAPKMSHQLMQNCTQCHAPSNGGGVVDESNPLMAGLVENEFVGAPPPGKGSRAYEGAPPTIPHPTSMRSDCRSCHGPLGAAALRTSHPWRVSCTQCHAPSAQKDQRLFSEEPFPFAKEISE